MKAFIFRCTKITHEEKKGSTIQGGNYVTTLEQSVSIQFEPAEKVGSEVDRTTYGYANLVLPVEDFKELGYEVGQLYSLKMPSETEMIPYVEPLVPT